MDVMVLVLYDDAGNGSDDAIFGPTERAATVIAPVGIMVSINFLLLEESNPDGCEEIDPSTLWI
jgi:hypothetical protein